MKILMISNMYPNTKFPSYGIFVKNFEEGLVELGHDFNKVVLRKETNKALKVFKYILFYFNIFFKCIFSNKDLVYVHYASHSSIPVLMARKFKKFKLCVNVHGSDVIPERTSQNKFQKYVNKMLNISDKIVVPSNYFKKVVIEKYKIKEEKIFISPSGGIDKRKFFVISDKNELKKKYYIKEEVSVIGYVGRLDVKKGWDILLKSIKYLVDNNKVNNKYFIIIGSGAESKVFDQKVNEYNLNNFIKHYDLLPQNQLVDFYNIFDVFCFPTLRDGESLGLVGIEAMACGVPVIGSNIAALPEYIIKGETGMLYEKDDYIQLAENMEYFSQMDKEIWRQYSMNALEKSMEYNSENILKNLSEELLSIGENY